MEQNCKLSDKFIRAIDEYAMLGNVRGVLVGFSGGADSSALLHMLKQVCESRGIYLAALHVHHGIRAEEADRDEEFCEKECRRLGIDFQSVHFDVPALAKSFGKGLEETARICRYEAFVKKVKSDVQLDCIATAHNADDNAETVLFNMARGCAMDGLYGIPPVRYENGVRVIRPLIHMAKSEILDCLCHIGAEHIFDVTNNDTAYRRNFIRHKIMPQIKEINPSFTACLLRMNKTLRRDGDYLDMETERFLSENLCDGAVSVKALCEVHEAVASRAVVRMLLSVGDAMPEYVHIEAVLSLAKVGREGSALSLCGGVHAVIARGMLHFTKEAEKEAESFEYPLSEGENRFDFPDFAVFLTKTRDKTAHLQKDYETLQNIYKLSIYTRLNFDKISGRLFVRSRRNGDAYVFGGMTRKLKKLYNDRGYPKKYRSMLPVFCDDEGIIWVPGFPAADRVCSDDKDAGGLVYYTNNGETV